jgi:homoserine O-acetyltransferase/O-succinyltransferase
LKIFRLDATDPSRIVLAAVLGSRQAAPEKGDRMGREIMKFLRAALSATFALTSFAALAADYPAPKQGDWIAEDFKFHTGETMPQLRLHYTTVGETTGQPVLVLHGSGGSATSMLTPAFAGELFGPGQPLDAAKYYIIIPDGIGHGKSSKPSDGMKTAFPKYDYEDMVDAQYRLVREGLGVKHLRLVIGNSMGGMHSWIWGVKYPQAMDALAPMASQPTEMASRNWMLRRMMLETIRNDPDYNGGNYTSQPRMMKYAINAYGIATGGGTLAYQTLAPTAAKADKMVDDRLATAVTADANDFIYQWEASHDYNPNPGMEKIEATLLAINAADDERNPPETGITDAAIKRVKNGKLYLIPASTETRGHLTTGNAKFYAKQLQELLQSAPQKTM